METLEKPQKIGCAGTRGAIKNADWIKTFGTVFATGNEWSCVPAHLINAIHYIEKVCAAKGALEQLESNVEFEKLALYSDIVHSHGEKLALQKVKKENDDSFSWLVKQTRGVFLVQVIVKNIDHCVVVNCGEKIIVDCAEKFLVKLT